MTAAPDGPPPPAAGTGPGGPPGPEAAPDAGATGTAPQGGAPDPGIRGPASTGGAPAAAPSPLSGKGLWAVRGLLILTAAIWGGTFAAGKAASEGAGPLTTTLWRFILASSVLIPQCALSRRGLLPRNMKPSTWGLIALSSVTGLVLYNIFFIKGLSLTGAGRGSVIVTVNPAFIYLGAVVFFGERLSLVRVAGLVLAVSGTLLVVSGGSLSALLEGRFNLGDLILLGCIVSWAAYSLLGKLLMGRISPLAGTTWTAIVAVALLLPFTLASGESLTAFTDFTLRTWAAIAFLGILGTALGFTFFYKGILALGPHKAGIFISLVPFFGLLSGALVFGEALTLSVGLGLALSLLGVALVQKY